jgi:hypothetical protein
LRSDPFELPDWNVDQALFWIATREPAMVWRAREGADNRLTWREYVSGCRDDAGTQRAGMRPEAAENGLLFVLRDDEPAERKTRASPGSNADRNLSGAMSVVVEVQGTAFRMGDGTLVYPRLDPTMLRSLYAPIDDAPGPGAMYRCDPERDQDPFIGWYDAALWLAKGQARISGLPEWREFELAEARIRKECNSGTLQAFGYRRGIEEKLEPITQLEWQPLKVLASGGQPQHDLDDNKARHYGYAYHKGTGCTAWTGLCFDRLGLLQCFNPLNEPHPTVTSSAFGEGEKAGVARRPRTQSERGRAKRALAALYGDKVPDQSACPNGHLNDQVNRWLKARQEPSVKLDTLLRAAGRRN